MKNRLPFLCFFIFVLAFTSCESNDNNAASDPNDETFAQNFGNQVQRDFIGQVVDTNNDPIPGVTIRIGTSAIQTDVNGVFILNNVTVYERFAYIKAVKAGYLDGSRSLVPTSGKNTVKIMLLSNAPLQTISSGVTSEVALSSGTKVVFDGAFEDANGNNYSGSVQVFLFHLLPSHENISQLMPGMLYAQTESNEAVVLETFGMLNVELRGSSGQKLHIKKGHTAQITLKIDDSQLGSAPSSIPLWHFDEAKGYWKEDGVATKVGNKYVGEVSHFSWWNCDAPFALVNLTLTVVDMNGNGISNLGVGLLTNGSSWPVMGYTNINGQVSGLIPANQTLVLNVYPGYSNFGCVTNNVIYSTTIGPFTTDATLPNIVINNSPETMTTQVFGNLVKCDNTNVTNGYILLKRFGTYSYLPVTNGTFSFNEVYCPDNAQFTLKGYDFDNLQETDSISYNFTPVSTAVGNLQACNTVTSFASYQIDNNPPVFLLAENGGVSAGTVGFYANFYGNSHSMSVVGNNISGQGIYGCPPISLVIDNTQFYSIPNTIQCNLSQDVVAGGYLDMTFNGTYIDATGTHTITGVIHTLMEN